MFDALNDEHTEIGQELFDSWQEYLKNHRSECFKCRAFKPLGSYYDIKLDATCVNLDFNKPYTSKESIYTITGTEYYVNFLTDERTRGYLSYVCLYVSGDRKVKYREYISGRHHHNSSGPSRITYDAEGRPKDLKFHLPNGGISSFWDYYEKASEEVKSLLLKKWLPYV